MSKNIFSPKEVKELSENSYVKQVTTRSLTMLPEFKKLAFEEMIKGKSIRQVFEMVGINPDFIGEIRMNGYRDRIWREADRENGFEDGRKNNHRHDAESENAKLKRKISQLEHRVAYLQQENEFIKKIQQVEKEYGGKAEKQS